MTNSSRRPVIVGAALSDYPKAPHLSEREHHAQAMQRALANSGGVKKSDIDGFMTASMGDERHWDLAEYLQIDHRAIGEAGIGGAIFEFMVQHACAAIAAGQCDTVLMTYGSDLLTRYGRSLGTGNWRDKGPVERKADQFEAPYGANIVANYAMAARRHMHEFGTTSEQLAEIAVAMRHNAQFNPHAMYREPITTADVLKSKMVANPLHMLDCCLICDGGGAIIITTEERARDLDSKPIYVLGAAGAQTHWNMSQMPDFTHTAAAIAGADAFRQAGIRPADVDTVQLYDSFTITVLMLLEDLGFCGKGEGGQFVANGRLKVGGELPCNTDGGGLSSCHSGMRGMHLLVEAVRQLRGDCGPSQVADAKIAVACGSGGYLSGMAAVVLGRDRP